jgi:hypothetical protein
MGGKLLAGKFINQNTIKMKPLNEEAKISLDFLQECDATYLFELFKEVNSLPSLKIQAGLTSGNEWLIQNLLEEIVARAIFKAYEEGVQDSKNIQAPDLQRVR